VDTERVRVVDLMVEFVIFAESKCFIFVKRKAVEAVFLCNGEGVGALVLREELQELHLLAHEGSRHKADNQHGTREDVELAYKSELLYAGETLERMCLPMPPISWYASWRS